MRYTPSTLIDYYYPSADGDMREVLTVEMAIKRQKSSVLRLGMHYTNDDDALSDFMTVHWAKLAEAGSVVGVYASPNV